MKVSVAVPVYKHPELTESFLTQFFQNTILGDIELVVCDDASNMPELTDVLTRWQQRHPDVMKVIVRAENGGFPGATNDAIRATTGDHVICLSNDVNILDPRWVDALVTPLTQKKCITGGQFIDYNTLTYVDGTIVPYIGGWCMAFSRHFLHDLGGVIGTDQVFEESFKPGYFEDVLVSFYAKYVMGYELVAPGRLYPAMDIHLTHIGGQTINAQVVPVEQIAEKNRLGFMDIVRLELLKYGKTL